MTPNQRALQLSRTVIPRRNTLNRTILLAIAVITTMSACQAFEPEVHALLDEAGTEYRIINCSDALRDRKMYCDLQIEKDEVDAFIESLGLNKPTPNGEAQNRIIYLSGGLEFDNQEIENSVSSAFGTQLWAPSRHGFAGAFLIYEPGREVGRLWLSIAYG